MPKLVLLVDQGLCGGGGSSIFLRSGFLAAQFCSIRANPRRFLCPDPAAVGRLKRLKRVAGVRRQGGPVAARCLRTEARRPVSRGEVGLSVESGLWLCLSVGDELTVCGNPAREPSRASMPGSALQPQFEARGMRSSGRDSAAAGIKNPPRCVKNRGRSSG